MLNHWYDISPISLVQKTSYKGHVTKKALIKTRVKTRQAQDFILNLFYETTGG